MTRIILLPAMTTLFAFGGYGDNLLTNPGFESGDFSGWTVSANTPVFGVASSGFLIPGTDTADFFGPSTVIVHSGNFAAYTDTCANSVGPCFPSGDTGDELELSQTVDVMLGKTYDIGFWLGNGSAVDYENESAIFVNGVAITLTNFPSIAPGYQFEDGLYTATKAGPVQITFLLQGSGTGDAGVSFDDFQVLEPRESTVPEPATLFLLVPALGIAVLSARPRRSRSSSVRDRLPIPGHEQ